MPLHREGKPARPGRGHHDGSGQRRRGRGRRRAGRGAPAAGMGHSRRLMPAVDFLLRGLDIPPSAVEGFAVTAGPGSFTGLRVGLACVQGLALASGRPCLALGTLDVLAARIAGAADTLVAVMDAHRGEVYVGDLRRRGAAAGRARDRRPRRRVRVHPRRRRVHRQRRRAVPRRDRARGPRPGLPGAQRLPGRDAGPDRGAACSPRAGASRPRSCARCTCAGPAPRNPSRDDRAPPPGGGDRGRSRRAGRPRAPVPHPPVVGPRPARRPGPGLGAPRRSSSSARPWTAGRGRARDPRLLRDRGGGGRGPRPQPRRDAGGAAAGPGPAAARARARDRGAPGGAGRRTSRCATATRPPARCTGRWASPRSAAATATTRRPSRTRSCCPAPASSPNLEKPPVPVLTSRHRAFRRPRMPAASPLRVSIKNREVSMTEEPGLRQRLLAQNEEYRRLDQQHHEYESLLVPLHGEGRPQRRRAGRGDDAQEEEAPVKDRMEAIARQAREAHAG